MPKLTTILKSTDFQIILWVWLLFYPVVSIMIAGADPKQVEDWLWIFLQMAAVVISSYTLNLLLKHNQKIDGKAQVNELIKLHILGEIIFLITINISKPVSAMVAAVFLILAIPIVAELYNTNYLKTFFAIVLSLMVSRFMAFVVIATILITLFSIILAFASWSFCAN